MKNRNRKYIDRKKQPAKGENMETPRPGGADQELPVAPVEDPQMSKPPVEGKPS